MESIVLNIEDPIGSHFKLENVKKSFTVKHVKANIQEERHLLFNTFDLTYNGVLLDDNKSLDYYGIDHDDHLVLLCREGYTVFNAITGKNMYFPDAQESWTVQRLKNEIMARCEQSGSVVSLIYNAGYLQNDRTLGSYNIKKGTSITMTVRVSGGADINLIN